MEVRKKDNLGRRFRRTRYEPVLRQVTGLLYLVNRKRRGRGLPPVPKDCVRTKLRMISAFEESPGRWGG